MDESVFKVLLIGDHGVGKTSYIASYVLNRWIPNLKTTIGADYAVKCVKWSDTITVRLHLWDIAGQDRFHAMARTYFKGASGCVIMFDVTNRKSFENAQDWKSELDAKVELPSGQSIPCVLIGNKNDLQDKKVVSHSELQKLGIECGFVYSTFLSAKEGQNLSEPMHELIRSMLEQKQTATLLEDKLSNDRIPGESLADIRSKDTKCCYSAS